MYACPSCGQRSISYLHKWLSWSAAPARCSACGGGCAIAVVDASGALIAGALIVSAGGFAAVTWRAPSLFVAGLFGAAAYYFWRQHRARLQPVSAAEAASAKRSGWALLLAWLFPNFLS